MRRTLVLCTAGILISLAAAGEAGTVPDVLYLHGNRPFPSWVAAEKIFTPEGTLNSTLLSPAARYGIAKAMELPLQGDCILVTDQGESGQLVEGPDSKPRNDLASTTRSSDWVFTARVTARASGFNGSVPGTLLQIVPEDVLKGPKNRVGEHYVFMPSGTVKAGKLKFCKSNPKYSDLPEVGERVLLLVNLTYINQGKFLLTGNESGIITIREDGKVSLPARHRNNDKALANGTAEDLLRFVQEALEEED